MSPLALRRYRADRLLRDEFEGLRASVLAKVHARLAGSDVSLDERDLEACYAQAWQGLYVAVLAGEEIASPGGWLATVCFRRALDEHRSRKLPGRRLAAGRDLSAEAIGGDGDFAAELDDRARLRQLMEGIGASMGEREREAASLCFLQGLSRAEAARAMGIAPRRLERLMDGRGARSPGVSAKLGALVETIAAGRFCEERASTMRALAFGVLDPDGERHRLAIAHQRSCPACRAYVLQLRGLASALPPILLPGVFAAAGASERAANGGRIGRFVRSRRRGLRHRLDASRAFARARRATGALSRPTLAGGTGSSATAAAPGGGAGSVLGAKLAVVGLLAVGAGAGALALSTQSGQRASRAPAARQDASNAPTGERIDRSSRKFADADVSKSRPGDRSARTEALQRARSLAASRLVAEPPPSLVWREFGFERSARPAGRARTGAAGRRTAASGARARTRPTSAGTDASATPSPTAAQESGSALAPESEAVPEAGSGDSSTPSVSAQALREFGIE